MGAGGPGPSGPGPHEPGEPGPGEAAARARRYLLEGDPAMALGACEAALREAGALEALGLRLAAARAAAALGDLDARLRHLEAAEATARASAPDALGAVLAQLGQAHLARGEPGRAAVALEEAAGRLAADDPLLPRARADLEEAAARAAAGEAEGAGDEPAPAPPPLRLAGAGAAPGGQAERVLGMIEALLEGDTDLDLAATLDLVLGELVRAAEADRGFVLLRDAGAGGEDGGPGEGGLVLRAARDRDGAPVPDAAREVSRKVAERAASAQVALRAVRPAEDPRFAGSRSVKALDLRAVVAAPLRYRRVDLGCVLLDRRGRKDQVAFDDAAEALVERFARLASGVIVRARRRDAERRRADALQALFAHGVGQVRAREGAVEGIVGESQPIYELLRLIERVAPTEARVLIRGESGTGKELVARALHDGSARARGPFHAINCGALPEGLLEGELFGHVKGAYTGADADRPGLFERAAGGTLFLDEIGDAGARLQTELLRVLQEGEVRRLGDGATRKIDVRVLAATHRDLEAMVAEGRFREDLLYRLNVVQVRVPSLAERPGDVPLLVRHFEREARRTLGDPAKAHPIGEAEVSALAARPWPGNVRELRNAVLRLVTLGDLASSPATRPTAGLGAPAPPAALGPGGEEDAPYDLLEVERRAVVRALRKTGGAKIEAAKLLGVTRRTLYNKIRQFGLE